MQTTALLPTIPPQSPAPKFPLTRRREKYTKIPVKITTVKITQALRDMCKVQAAIEGIALQAWISGALLRALPKKEKK